MLVAKLAFHLKGESRSIVHQLNSDVKAECADIKSQLLPRRYCRPASWIQLVSIKLVDNRRNYLHCPKRQVTAVKEHP